MFDKYLATVREGKVRRVEPNMGKKKQEIVEEPEPVEKPDPYLWIKDKNCLGDPKLYNLVKKIEKTDRVVAEYDKLLERLQKMRDERQEKGKTDDRSLPVMDALVKQLTDFVDPNPRKRQFFFDYTVKPFDLSELSA